MEVLREAYENYNKKDYRYDFFAKEEEIKDLLSNKQIFVFKRNNRNLIFGFVLSEILVPLLASLLVFQFVGNFIIALICFLALFSFILIVFISFRKDFLVIGYTGLYFKKYLKKAQYIPWSTFGKIEYYKGMTGEGNKNFYVICRLSAGKRYKFYPHVYLGNEFRRRIIIGSKVFELCIYFYGLFLHYWENTQVNTEYTVDDKPEVNQAKLIEETSEVISEKKSSEISCPNCGKNNAESSQYCEACGSELNTIQQDLFEDISFDPGDREKIFVMTKIPGDFNIFLDKLSEIMLASN
ncbi:MAG: zinc ribbon domain-containing protein, partial [Promethearchaeota archaeon]